MKKVCDHVHCEYHYFEDVINYLDINDEYNVIVGVLHDPRFVNETMSYVDKNKKNILIQISEESEEKYNSKLYEHFYKIFRAYNVNNKVDYKKIYPIPCGYVTRLNFKWHNATKPKINNTKPLKDRNYDVFFSGQSDSERNKMVNAFNKIGTKYNSYVELTKKFVSGMPLQEYYNVICDSKICLVPKGVCINETFRYFESSLSNSIIITTQQIHGHKFNNIWYYKDSKAIVLNNWNELTENVIDDALDNLEYYERGNRKYFEENISPKAVANYINNNL